MVAEEQEALPAQEFAVEIRGILFNLLYILPLYFKISEKKYDRNTNNFT
jgi:hypothetical protein